MPKISVIVPVYNSEKYLSRCVDSIINQSFRDFELILVDDGSTDQSAAICDDFISKTCEIDIIAIHQQNAGQSAARNHGIDVAKGRWVTFVDSDDYVHPQYLEILYKGVSPKTNRISLCGAVFRAPDHIGTFPIFECINEEKLAVDESFFLNLYISQWQDKTYQNEVIWGKLIPIDIVKQYPLTEGRIYEDSAVMGRWFHEAGTVIEYKHPLYYYTDNPNGTMNAVFSERKLDKLWSLEEMEKFYREQNYVKMEQIMQESYLYMTLKYEEECEKQDLKIKIRKMRHSKAIKSIPFWNESIKKKISDFSQYYK